LFSQLACGAFGREDCYGSHLDSKVSDDSTTAKPLSVLPSKVTPLCVPKEETFLKGRQVVIGFFSNSFKGKCLGCAENAVEGSDDWKRRLLMVSNG
jgi:hypothetical protein